MSRDWAALVVLASIPLGCADPSPKVSEESEHATVDERSSDESATHSDPEAAIDSLIDYTAQRRATLDFATLPPWSHHSGANPFALLADKDRTIGLLRRGQLTTFDRHAQPIATVSTTDGASALIRRGAELIVASESSGTLHRLDAATLRSRHHTSIDGVHSIRSIAWGTDEHRLYLADLHRHRILSVAWPPSNPTHTTADEVDPACGGALSVARTGSWLVYNCLLDHRLVARWVFENGSLGAPVAIEHNGPIWGMDTAVDETGALWVLAGGVENHPLDRSDGAFGFIDSFAYVYEITGPGHETPAPLRPVHELNVSEHGVVTPKRVQWLSTPNVALITSYGSDVALELTWAANNESAHIKRFTLAPGITDFVGDLEQGIFASPLLDAWIVTRPDQAPRIVMVPDPTDRRTPSERLGEALAFTTIIAPHGLSEGKRSRFTCETCHFEARTDGRTHWTGRQDVHATTKTLRGLTNNRPHFSRALDQTTAGMVDNEFSVASRGTGSSAWFTLTRAEAPWLDALGAPPDPLSPVTQRRALIDFLFTLTPEPNPAITDRSALSAEQQRGARAFAAHCESCHQARLVADEPESRVPPEQWEQYILNPTGGIVWGADIRAQTGVEPYVHPQGSRVPSLRRLWVKRPFLTNGSATSLDQILRDIRIDTPKIHGGGPGPSLDAPTQQALASFIDLL